MEKTMEKLPKEIQNSLKELTSEEIINLRLNATEKRFIIIKIGAKLYYTPIRKREQLEGIRSAFGKHLCCNCGNFFNNGELCPKVADLSEETNIKEFVGKREAIIESKRIEKYTFVTVGVEYFNSQNKQKEYFVVEKCSRFKMPNDQAERDALFKKMQDEADEERKQTIIKSRKRRGSF